MKIKKGALKSVLVKTGGAVAGAVAAKYVKQAASKLPASFPSWAAPLAVIVAGAFLPKIAGGKAKPGGFVDAASISMMGAGGAQLLGSFGVPGLQGIGDDGGDDSVGQLNTLGRIGDDGGDVGQVVWQGKSKTLGTTGDVPEGENISLI